MAVVTNKAGAAERRTEPSPKAHNRLDPDRPHLPAGASAPPTIRNAWAPAVSVSSELRSNHPDP